MARPDPEKPPEEASRREAAVRPGRILVDDAGHRRPFMRGIMIHSLMERGVPFEEAFLAANEVRDRIRGRAVVEKDELARTLRGILGPAPFREQRRPPPLPTITVAGRGEGLPFSKGVLSQSLLAAGIDPNDAFDVAREIEGELLRRGDSQVDRRALRRLAYETLSRQQGEPTAERYLVWRKFQEPDQPVMILLGGTAGVGKTSLALEVAHRLGIARLLSTDSVRQIMRIMLSADLVPAIHGSSYDAYRLMPPESLGPSPVIEGFRAQASTVSVGVRASMDRAVSENASLVIDGVSLVPGLVDLEAYAGLAHVIFLIVGCLDEQSFRNRFAARAEDQRRRPRHRYLENLDSILRIQEHLLELADRYDVPIVNNVSFDGSVALILRHVAETLRKSGSFDAEALL